MCSKIYIFQPFICKTINYSDKLFIQDPLNYILMILWSAKIFFIFKFNKFGKPQAGQKLQDSPGPQNQTFFLNSDGKAKLDFN